MSIHKDNLANRQTMEKLLNSPSLSLQEVASMANVIEQTGTAPQADLLFVSPERNAFTLLGMGYIKTLPEEKIISEASLSSKPRRFVLTISGKEALANALKQAFESVVERTVERTPLDKLREKAGVQQPITIEEEQASEKRFNRAKENFLKRFLR